MAIDHRYGVASRRLQRACLFLFALVGLGAPQLVHAFCGFYVTGADTSLYANATMVVMMRDGTRTVLSMQNNYQGPPEAFALVIPVPSVLTKEQVRTLPRDVFQHVDVLGAPRLVEYWEVDPCRPVVTESPRAAAGDASSHTADAGSASVTVEARFSVGEYDVVILSANDSSGLETWLHENKYNIPQGADKVLAPYVAAGTKFFVAKVDPTRVTFDKGQAALSPLRFHYDSPEFSLPVRLGLLNSQGTQDLIVSILAPQRYEAMNHPNVTIPTNIRVQNSVRDGFPSFYEALFAKVLEKNPGAVVTEYAWNANSCDPCPTPALSPEDLATLGADVTQPANNNGQTMGGFITGSVDYVLTRLHYRYTAETLGDDLLFARAAPLIGGRGIPNNKGELESTKPAPSEFNNFQGRYVILHPWEKQSACVAPVRGTWGGPDGFGSNPPAAMPSANTALLGAPPAAGNLRLALAEAISALDVTPISPLDPLKPAAAAGTGGAVAGATAGKAGSQAAGAGANPVKAPSSGCSVTRAGSVHSNTSVSALSGLSLALVACRRARRRS
ncbi:MAG: hypothetical protein RL701_252 [Pseudomonadota bacterium]